MNQKMCDQGLLNRFFDEELGPGEYAHMTEHLKACPACQRVLRENQALSNHLGAGLDEELSRADLERVEENVLALIRRKETPWRTRLRDLLVSKRFFVPATAMVAVFVLFFALFRHPSSMPGPSAIVSSVEGDVASVMILETPESHQTIVWITENLASNGSDNGNG
jgi:anti-sigma factor RsiW